MLCGRAVPSGLTVMPAGCAVGWAAVAGGVALGAVAGGVGLGVGVDGVPAVGALDPMPTGPRFGVGDGSTKGTFALLSMVLS